ncbi:toll/interleukin-1 receptor domain-containing protein [Cryobacterium arcticum]|nr:toll/interleukin-1 receptor domain-containing protein [Cryobacterium arcticum]
MQLPLSQRHAFLSYIHEDKVHVDELQEALEAAGIQVWRDTRDLWPGEDWQAKIRAAIKSDSIAFIACFSAAGETREKSYQYEELTLAVDEYRQRRPKTSWLFTVRFDDCAVPEFDLGGGRTLDSTIQRTDLFGPNKTVQTVRLSQAVGRVTNPPSSPTIATEAVAEAKKATSDGRSRAEVLKQLLRDPAADIALEDFMSSIATEIRTRLSNEDNYPSTTPDVNWAPFADVWLAQLRNYEKELEPALDLVRLAASYGQVQHNPAWERFMRQFTSQIVRGNGNAALINLRAYPALVLLYVSSIASTSRDNYVPILGLVVTPTIRDQYNSRESIPLVQYTNVRSVAQDVEPIASALAMADDGTEVLPALIEGLVSKAVGGRLTPISDHLHTLLRDLFRDELPDQRDYSDVFDRAEVLLDALVADAAAQHDRATGWAGGYGRYTWRHRHVDMPVEAQMLADVISQGEAWRPILDGLFGGSVERATAALESVKTTAARVRSQHW